MIAVLGLNNKNVQTPVTWMGPPVTYWSRGLHHVRHSNAFVTFTLPSGLGEHDHGVVFKYGIVPYPHGNKQREIRERGLVGTVPIWWDWVKCPHWECSGGGRTYTPCIPVHGHGPISSSSILIKHSFSKGCWEPLQQLADVCGFHTATVPFDLF